MIIIQEAKDPAKAQSRMDGLCHAVKNKMLYTIIVEPSSKCNLACTFCDLHSGRIDGTEALKGHMSENTFFNLVDQLAAGSFVLKELQYHGNGEPMLNKKLPDFIRYAKAKGVAKKHRLTTNGTMMTPQNLEKAVQAGIDEIHVSLDMVDRDAYGKLKGCDLYGKVDANLEHAISYIEEHGQCMLYIKYAVPHASEDYGFTQEMANAVVEKYRERTERSQTIHLRGMPVVTLLDGKAAKTEVIHSPCELPFYTLFVKYDGRVSICCVDLFEDLHLGNVNDVSIHDIIGGEELRSIRMQHLVSDLSRLPICLHCGNRSAVQVEAVAQELRRYV